MRVDRDYPTIRQNAAMGPLSEHQLRLMQKQGILPGFHVGNHFRVNRKLFLELLEAKSMPGERPAV